MPPTQDLPTPRTDKKNTAVQMVAIAMPVSALGRSLAFATMVGTKEVRPNSAKAKKVTILFLTGFSSPAIS